jgi:uridine kinase
MPGIGFIKPSKGVHILGVSGGSGSGKTYFAAALCQRLGPERCAVVYQDSFYIDQSAHFDFDGGAVNFDHPDSIDFPLLAAKLTQLKNGEAADLPIYDFKTHSRRLETERMESRPVILVDGILIFHSVLVRSLFDDLVFFDTDESLRYQRRMNRDVNDRGRTIEGVQKQFLLQVKPMHDAFVEPSKVFARTTIQEIGEFDSILERYCQKLLKLCE